LELGVTAMRMVCRFPKAKEKPRSIFVLRNNDLGDLVVTTPLFKALRMAFPEAFIVAGVSSWSKEILKNNPYISEVIDCNAPWHNHRTPKKSLKKALQYIFGSHEAEKLKAHMFDVGIDVVGSPFGSMLLMHLQIPVRLGRKGYAGGHSGATAYLENTNTESVARGALGFVRLLKHDAEIDVDTKPQLFLSALELEEGAKVWREIEETVGSGKPRIVVAPGAGTLDKQWPAKRFAELVSRISADTCGCVLGSEVDTHLGEEIAHEVPGWSDRCGKVSIRQSMALISLADMVICHTSLVMHLATCFNKPSVLILTRAVDPKVHAFFWEVEGVHHQLYPSGDAQHVSVDEAEEVTSHLLASIPHQSRQRS
jgi:heptosyltransferase-2